MKEQNLCASKVIGKYGKMKLIHFIFVSLRIFVKGPMAGKCSAVAASLRVTLTQSLVAEAFTRPQIPAGHLKKKVAYDCLEQSDTMPFHTTWRVQTTVTGSHICAIRL